MKRVLLLAPLDLGDLPDPPNQELVLEVVRTSDNGSIIVVSDIGVYTASSKNELVKLLSDISRVSRG